MANNLQEVRTHLIDALTPALHQPGFYICPLCGSGSHGHGSTAAFSVQKDGIHGKCFSCGFYGDIFDLEAAITGKDLKEATRNVVARYDFNNGTVVEKWLMNKANASVPANMAYDIEPAIRSSSLLTGSPNLEASAASAADSAAAPVPEANSPTPPPAADFSAALRLAADRLPGSAGELYLSGRGFTPETMKRFLLGFDPVKNEITIPYNRACTYYSTRSLSDAGIKHRKPANVPSVLFNAAALRLDQPCFVVESPLCAISIMQEGGSAIALSGATNHQPLLKELTEIPAPALLILSLDNDAPGAEQQAKLAEELTAAGIGYIELPVSGECKDPNELLQKDPAQLRENIAAACAAAEALAAQLKEQEQAAYLETSTAGTFDDFLAYLRRNADRDPVPTGFPSLDRILNGGLVPGLYIMGAVSSLGKTALMVNIADNIAAAGTDVLYFSLEMSKFELMARSISRLSFSLAGKDSANLDEAFSTFGVLFGASKIEAQDSLLKDAAENYRQGIAPNIWYHEGVGSISVENIRDAVRNHIAKTGRKPVVFVDYLQIIAAPDPRATDKHNTDIIVTTLKQMSRDEDIPVFCISSLNRMNYNEPVNMAAFKESGAIEYGSDVLIGLQLYGLGWEGHETQNQHKARIQKLIEKAEKDDQISIQVRVLKNRNGRRGDSGEMRFTKRFNSFFEVPEGFSPVYSNENPFTGDDEDDEPI